MRALCWHGRHDVRVEPVPDPKILNPRDAIVRVTATRDLRLGPAPLQRLHARRWRRATSSATSSWAKSSRSAAAVKNLQGRRPRGRALSHRLRQLLLLPAAALFAVRELQPERLDGGEAMGPLALRHLRLLAHARRLRGRPGRVRARAVRRRRPDQGARGADATSRCCSCPTSSRPATWRRRTATSSRGDMVAVWGCGPVGQFAIAQRAAARRRARHRHRPLPRAAADGARRKPAPRRSTTSEANVLEALTRDDRRPRPGRLHRRRRHGSARAHDLAYAYDRVKQAMMLETDRPGRAARGDHGVPQAAARSRSPASTAASSTSSRSAR